MTARGLLGIVGCAVMALVVSALVNAPLARAEGPAAEAPEAFVITPSTTATATATDTGTATATATATDTGTATATDTATATVPGPATVAGPATASAPAAPSPFSVAQQSEVVIMLPETVAVSAAPDDAAPHGGIFFRGRGGPSLGVDPLAFGGAITAFVGYENAMGLGFGVQAGARWLRGDGYSVLDFSAGAIFRVSALPENRFHPFGELGIALHLPNEATGDQSNLGAVVGGDFALGLEVDITPSFSLEFAGRGEVLVRKLDSYSVFLTPFMGFVAHL